MPGLSPAAQKIFDKTGIPPVGLGTSSARTPEEATAAILRAIEAGYRHLDTAQNYQTEGSVGEAVRRSGIPRSEFFLTTKVGDARLDKASFLPSVEKSLATMGVEQIDLLLVHWALKDDSVPFESYMADLAAAKSRGWARMIGVSNYPIARLQQADALLGRDALVTDQVEISPYLQAPKLTAFCRTIGLTLTAYRPLAQGKVASDPLLQQIGARHGVPAATIALAFLIAEGHIVIPASADPQRLRDNLKAREVELTADEVAQIRGLDRGERIINPAKSPAWDD